MTTTASKIPEAPRRRGQRHRDPSQLVSRCGGCGLAVDGTGPPWPDYWCPRCGLFNAALYRAEHVDPAYAATLTLPQIAAECRAAGITARWRKAP